MGKESMRGQNYVVNKDDRRTEIIDKVNFDSDSNNNGNKNVKVDLVDTLALDDLITEINDKNFGEDEKRSEIMGKFNSNKELSNIEKIESKILELIVNSNDDYDINRSEIASKFKLNENEKKHNNKISKSLKNVDIDMVNTIALDGVIEKINDININDKRTEIVDKIKNVKKNNREELNNEVDVDLEIEDKVQENVENISIMVIVMIVVVCSILGTAIGYMLYKIAMSNSGVMASIFRYII